MRTVFGAGLKSVCGKLASLLVQALTVVANPVTVGARLPLTLQDVTASTTHAVIVIDATCGRFAGLFDGVEVVYFRHGNFSNQ